MFMVIPDYLTAAEFEELCWLAGIVHALAAANREALQAARERGG